MPISVLRVPPTYPINQPLHAVVDRVPCPDLTRIALIPRATGLLLVVHPGAIAIDVLPAVIDAMRTHYRPQLAQWFLEWGHAGELDYLIAHWPRITRHQLGIVVTDDSIIPSAFRPT